jgi:hypothetical protein
MMQTSSIDDDMCVEETIIINGGDEYFLNRIITDEERQTNAILSGNIVNSDSDTESL